MTIYLFKVVFWNGRAWQMCGLGSWAVCRRLARPGERILALGG
jgi:hypothetical protein